MQNSVANDKATITIEIRRPREDDDHPVLSNEIETITVAEGDADPLRVRQEILFLRIGHSLVEVSIAILSITRPTLVRSRLSFRVDCLDTLGLMNWHSKWQKEI